MKKIFLILLLFVSLAFSAIDECKTDVYFGNGILTEEKDARLNALKILSPALEEDIYGTETEMKKHIGKVDYAYNSTHLAGIHDLIESLFQKLSVTEYLDKLKKLGDEMRKTAHHSPVQYLIENYPECHLLWTSTTG